MMISFLALFITSLLGMSVIAGKNLAKVSAQYSTSSSSESLPTRSSFSVTVAIVSAVEYIIRRRVIPFLFYIADAVLVVIEFVGKQISKLAGRARRVIHLRSNIIPRESLYWKEIYSWKKKKSINSNKEIDNIINPDDSDQSSHHF